MCRVSEWRNGSERVHAIMDMDYEKLRNKNNFLKLHSDSFSVE
jgi:hypothetical protein